MAGRQCPPVTIERVGGGEAELCPQCRNEPRARSLAELRDELRRQVERIAEEEDARKGLPLEDDEEDEAVPADQAA